MVIGQGQFPTPSRGAEPDGGTVGIDLQCFGSGWGFRGISAEGGCEGGLETGRVKEGFALAGEGIDADESLGAGSGVDPVPEGGVVVEPFGADAAAEDGVFRALGEGKGAVVVGLGTLGECG